MIYDNYKASQFLLKNFYSLNNNNKKDFKEKYMYKGYEIFE